MAAVASPGSLVGRVRGSVDLFPAVVFPLDAVDVVLLLLCSRCYRFEDVVSEVSVALGRYGMSSVAVGGADDIVLVADSCLAGGLGLDPLTAHRSSLVKLELGMETLPPLKLVLPG